jgi:hypothetical protein
MLNDERHISGVVYMLSLIERERRQLQLKIIYFEAHYHSSFFKTMTCQTVRRYQWIYVCRSKNRIKINGRTKMMILFLWTSKKEKRDWLNSAYLIRFCSYLSFSFSYINIDFLFFSLLKKSVERIEKLMTLKSSAERTSDRARTITFVDKEGGERERERTRFLLST